jgi:hypothetical protein
MFTLSFRTNKYATRWKNPKDHHLSDTRRKNLKPQYKLRSGGSLTLISKAHVSASGKILMQISLFFNITIFSSFCLITFVHVLFHKTKAPNLFKSQRETVKNRRPKIQN